MSSIPTREKRIVKKVIIQHDYTKVKKIEMSVDIFFLKFDSINSLMTFLSKFRVYFLSFLLFLILVLIFEYLNK